MGNNCCSSNQDSPDSVSGRGGTHNTDRQTGQASSYHDSGDSGDSGTSNSSNSNSNSSGHSEGNDRETLINRNDENHIREEESQSQFSRSNSASKDRDTSNKAGKYTAAKNTNEASQSSRSAEVTTNEYQDSDKGGRKGAAGGIASKKSTSRLTAAQETEESLKARTSTLVEAKSIGM